MRVRAAAVAPACAMARPLATSRAYTPHPMQGGVSSGSSAYLASLGFLAVGIMAPVTLPVPVLRELVHDRFGVSELLTSLFMSVNMIGALVAAPLVGALADRIGRRRAILVGALGLDALCFFALTAKVPFALFLAVRFVEGCAHIAARSEERRVGKEA